MVQCNSDAPLLFPKLKILLQGLEFLIGSSALLWQLLLKIYKEDTRTFLLNRVNPWRSTTISEKYPHLTCLEPEWSQWIELASQQGKEYCPVHILNSFNGYKDAYFNGFTFLCLATHIETKGETRLRAFQDLKSYKLQQ